MFTLTSFDIPFMANAIRIHITTSAVVVIDDALYNMSGSVYYSGSYDTFKAYPDGTIPANSGYGWAGPWRCETRVSRRLLCADVLLDYSSSFIYAAGTTVSGSDTGYGWDGAWNVIEGS